MMTFGRRRTAFTTKRADGSLVDWMTLGGSLALSRRNYRTDIVVGTNDKRDDTIFSPGATLLFNNLFAYQTDLRFDYRYIHDRSNDATKSFDDHIVSMSVVKRFDPNLMRFWP